MTEPAPLSVHEANRLAACLEHLPEQFNEAEPLLLRNLCYAEQQVETDIAQCAQIRLNLSKVYLYQGRTGEALESFQQALEMVRHARDGNASAAIEKYRLMFEMM
ncbi:MAG: tetratricopeptide repeat protein [Planctomycetota bacterium]|nr:tetratricopeptide repeat protein [Planctomycetota bacterium]